ncbi:hypothetical protein LTS15_006581 [Exophiala xenobiotica]|nr:hypothetical protein LTS15_006581 [Exophiala xenobiotica]
MPPKRVRTVEGSCWSCKQRRVKCDLQKPSCGKCIVAGITKCNYDRILIKWDARPSKGSPLGNQLCLYHHSLPGSGGYNLAINERRAIDYFRSRVWPLFSTSTQPCAAPIAMAMADRSVLLATCVMADSHRVLFDGRNSKENVHNKRLHCLTTVRKRLADAAGSSRGMPLSTVLVAVLLMYFSDGFVECDQPSSSTLSHHAGARAIIDSLGGLPTIMSDGETSMKMLLSEFATTSLTNTLLHGTPPSFPPHVWETMDMNAVWWENTPPGMETFASIFRKMSELAAYQDLVSSGKQDFSIERIKKFEADLRPGYASISPIELADREDLEGIDSKPLDPDMVPSSALLRAFQHSANLYLYRAVCGLPANHYVVQQHAQACLDCIMGMPPQSKALNCALFPLLVAGAHAVIESSQQAILRKLDLVYSNLKFNAVKSIRSALEDLWKSPQQCGSWFDMFARLDPQALVL